MASRIRPQEGAPYYVAKSKPVKSKGYLAFVHLLPCVVTGTRVNIQAAQIVVDYRAMINAALSEGREGE